MTDREILENGIKKTAENLTKLQRSLNYNDAEMADIFHIVPESYRKLRTGQTRITEDKFIILKIYFGVSLDEFVGESFHEDENDSSGIKTMSRREFDRCLLEIHKYLLEEKNLQKKKKDIERIMKLAEINED